MSEPAPVALYELPARAVLRVSGSERVRWLDGMLSSDIATLAPGRAQPALALTHQGRIVADGFVLALPDALWFELERVALPLARAHLERFIIADDVTLSEAHAAALPAAEVGAGAGEPASLTQAPARAPASAFEPAPAPAPAQPRARSRGFAPTPAPKSMLAKSPAPASEPAPAHPAPSSAPANPPASAPALDDPAPAHPAPSVALATPPASAPAVADPASARPAPNSALATPPASEALVRFSVDGAGAARVLEECLGTPAPGALAVARASFAGRALLLAGYGFTGVPAVQVFAPASTAPALLAALRDAGGARLVVASAQEFECRRIEAGTPRFGCELDDSVLPAEARLDAAISETKGCYTGQEVVARMRSRGRVGHQLVGLRFADALPAPDAALAVAGAKVGEVTSAVRSPRCGAIGLGFVKTAHATPGTALAAGDARAEVTALPHAPA